MLCSKDNQSLKEVLHWLNIAKKRPVKRSSSTGHDEGFVLRNLLIS
jgi:hypothetical protein